MTATSVLVRPQGLHPRARGPTCPPPPLLRHFSLRHVLEKNDFILLFRCLLPFRNMVHILIFKGYFIEN